MSDRTIQLRFHHARTQEVYPKTIRSHILHGTLSETAQGSNCDSTKVWLNLDTTTLAPGFYTLVYTVTVTGPDGSTRVYEQAVELQALEVVG